MANQFNAEQQAAVEHADGPVLIVAGPGTGKTKTLTARIVHLLHEKSVMPEAILALTFTNKAAHEMRERVSAALAVRSDDTRNMPLICTFHALAVHLLPADDRAFVDESTRMEICGHIKKNKNIKTMSARDISQLVSAEKNNVEPSSDPMASELVQSYNQELAARHLRDFDDLLIGLYSALQPAGEGSGTSSTKLEKPTYQYILVDEFQDTNSLQYEILKLLDDTGNVFAIGDPLQSIYGFRGASDRIFARLEQDWPGTDRITLGTNYRSVAPVVRLANAIFPDAPQLAAYRQEPGRVQVIEVLNEFGEADYIVREIEQQIGGSDMLKSSQHHSRATGQTFKDFAVLYRTHAVARQVQRALENSGIPYQVAGEGSPYLTSAMQTVMQSLRYIGGRVETPEIKGFTGAQASQLLASIKIDAGDLTLTELAQRIIEKFALSYEKHEALRQFTNSLVPYDQLPLSEYLDHLDALEQQAYYDPAAEAVTLLTIHAAKGLEFSRVFLIAAEQGVLPLVRADKPSDIDEEKRLFYVAVTRARDELVMLYARSRQAKPQTLSSFISVLPEEVIKKTVDPELASQQQKAKHRALKRSQGSLF